MEILLLAIVIGAVVGLLKNSGQAMSEGEWGEMPLNGCGLIFGAIALAFLLIFFAAGGAALEGGFDSQAGRDAMRALDQDIADLITYGTSNGTPRIDAHWQERCADYRARGMTSTVCDRKGY